MAAKPAHTMVFGDPTNFGNEDQGLGYSWRQSAEAVILRWFSLLPPPGSPQLKGRAIPTLRADR